MMHVPNNTNSTAHQGFVILFVVLIASIILLIGAGIFTISLKQNVLSSTAKESQLAFSAADSAVECALYHDALGEIVLTGSGFECAGQSISISSPSPDVFEFGFSLTDAYGVTGDNIPCARVSVDRNYTENTISYTQILSRGYNVCTQDGDPAVDNPILLERVLEVKYTNVVVTGGTIPSGGSPDTGGGTPATPANPATNTALPTGSGL